MKQKTEIVFEIEETVAIKNRRYSVAFCGQCNRLVEMLTVEIAAVLYGASEREIFRRIETAEIHFVEAERVFVCPNSLINKEKKE